MALRINPNDNYFESEDEKAKFALDFIDKFIIYLPSYEKFHIRDYINHIDLNEKDKIRSTMSYIAKIMVEERLIQVPQEANAMHKMTEIGRYVKEYGGYYKYLEKMKEEAKSTQNFITNNLNGNNNSVNNAIGSDINIYSINKNTLNEAQRSELKDIGVQDAQIEELNEIVSEETNDTSERSKRIFAWVSSVTASMVSRGIYDHIPQLCQFVSQFF